MISISIERITRKKMWEEVADQIQGLIVSGRWKMGTKLPGEIELAKQFGVSRSTLRESLRELSSLGLVQIRHGEGTFVRYPEAEEFLNPLMPRLLIERDDVVAIMEARSMVEAETARLAAERATREELDALVSFLEQMEAVCHDRQQFAHLDHEFHKRIAIATHNKVIFKIYEAIEALLVSQQQVIVDYEDAIERGIRDHRAVFSAISSGNQLQAMQAMRSHMKHTYQAILANKRVEE